MAITIQNLGSFELGLSAESVGTGGIGTADFDYQTNKKSGDRALNIAKTGTNTSYVYCGERTSTGASSITVGSTGNGAGVGFWFYINTLPTSGREEVCQHHNAGSAGAALLCITSAGKLQIYNSDGTTQAGSDGTHTLSTGTWYHIEWHTEIGTDGSEKGNVWVNGESDIAATNGTWGSGLAMDGPLFGILTNRSGQDVDFVYDDWWYGSIGTSETPLGVRIVGTLRPDGNGTYTAFTGTYADVDESKGDTSDYVQSTAADTAETFTLSSTSSAGIGSTITCVGPIIYEQYVGTGAAADFRWYIGSTPPPYDQATSLTSSWSDRLILYPTSPATSSAWTTSELDGAEFGIEETAASTNRLRVSWVAVYVLAEAAAGGTTVALTGSAGTGAVGSLSLAHVKAVGGVAATGAIGSLTPGSAVTAALSGLEATGAVGALSLAHVKAISGVAATGAVGQPVASIGGAPITLSGVASTGAVGALKLSHSTGLTGFEATGAVGLLSPSASTSVSLGGVAATGAVGSLSLTHSLQLSGVAATGAVGDLGVSTPVNVALTGVEATGAVGSLGIPAAAQEVAVGGWPTRRKRWEPPEPPSAEEVRKQREALGILPKKARQAVQKVVERELSSAAADEESLRQAYEEAAAGTLQARAERALRNELAAKRQKFDRAMPAILDAILREGIARAAKRDEEAVLYAQAAAQEEADVQELLAIWIEM